MSDDWKPVVGWEHAYEINRNGAVRTIKKYKVVRSPYGRTKTVLIDPKPLSPYKDGTGRDRVQLREGPCNVTSRYVHDLVQQAWGTEDE